MSGRSTHRPLVWLPADRARALRFVAASPSPGQFSTDHADVRITMDADRSNGWMIELDGVLASYVALDDPTHLEFEYTRWIADMLDEVRPDEHLEFVHLGGAACSLPVYLATRRPGSRQLIIDFDAALIDLMRTQFGIRSSRRFALRTADALEGLRALPTASADVIVRDAFNADQTPQHLRGAEFAREVARVMRPSGIYLANIGDGPGLPMTRELLRHSREALALRPTERHNGHMAIISDPSVMRGRRKGNVVAALSRSPLPMHGWQQAVRRANLPARVTHGERLWAYL